MPAALKKGFKWAKIFLLLKNLHIKLENFKNFSFKVYPNPAVHSFLITPDKSTKIENLIIRNDLGVKVLEAYNLANKAEINISNLQAGIYVVTARTQSSIATQKLIIR